MEQHSPGCRLSSRPLCLLIFLPTELSFVSLSFLTHCWSVPPLSLFYRTLSSWHTLHPTGCCPYVPSPLLLPSSHLFWARDPAPPPWWPSLHCDTPRSSHPLPAACLLIGIGGEERIAVSHGLPLEPTELGQGHSHHSYATAAHSKPGERESEGCRS